MVVIVIRNYLFKSCMQTPHFPNRKKRKQKNFSHENFGQVEKKQKQEKYRLKHIAPDARLGRQ